MNYKEITLPGGTFRMDDWWFLGINVAQVPRSSGNLPEIEGYE